MCPIYPKQLIRADIPEVQKLHTRADYMEAYSRRENLKFVGIPELDGAGGYTKEVVFEFLEREVKLPDAREIEFQRVHRQPKGV